MTSDATPLRPLGTGELLDAAFGLYRALFAPLLLIQVLCVLPYFAVTVYAEAAEGDRPGLVLLASILAFTLGAVGTAATARLIGDRYLDRSMTAGDALRGMLPRWRAILGTALLTGVAVGASALPSLLTIVGAFFMSQGATSSRVLLTAVGLGLGGLLLLALPLFVFAGTALASIALVLEPDLSATGALGRSWHLTKGARLRVMLLLFALVVVLLIATAGTTGAIEAVVGIESLAGRVLIALGQSVMTVLFQPALYCVLTLLYYDRRVRLEGFDLEVLAAALPETAASR
jgi:hypothetical protein